MQAHTAVVQPVIYPESDGKPLGETDVHRQEILDLIAALSEHFRLDPQTYISGNLMCYYEEGNPAAVFSPDVFVVRGISNQQRRSYKLWEERQVPLMVIEVTSRSTRLEDQGTKRALYALLGVAEYYLFDPLAEYLKPPLQGFRLRDGEYLRIAEEADGALLCTGLGLRLVREGRRLALFDTTTGARLLRPAELAEARREAEARAAALEAEVARLRAELERRDRS